MLWITVFTHDVLHSTRSGPWPHPPSHRDHHPLGFYHAPWASDGGVEDCSLGHDGESCVALIGPSRSGWCCRTPAMSPPLCSWRASRPRRPGVGRRGNPRGEAGRRNVHDSWSCFEDTRGLESRNTLKDIKSAKAFVTFVFSHYFRGPNPCFQS